MMHKPSSREVKENPYARQLERMWADISPCEYHHMQIHLIQQLFLKMVKAAQNFHKLQLDDGLQTGEAISHMKQ